MSPFSSTGPRTVWMALAFSAALLVASHGSARAAAPKLLVGAPTAGSAVTGNFPVQARVATSKRSHVRSVSFYVNDKFVSKDRRRPFAISPGKTFSANLLALGKGSLTFKARVKIRKRGGRIVTRTLRRVTWINVFRPPTAAGPLPPSSWSLAFEDNFDDPASSINKWNTQRDDWIKGGRPYSNLEGAGYLSSNVAVAGGTLNISTATTSASGYPLSTGSVNTHKRFAFQYGYLESRVLVPSCSGCWPAFWLLASDDKWPPEIDVFEFFNTAGGDKQPWSSLHWPAANAAGEEYKNDLLAQGNYVGTWHTYGVFWSEQQMQFFIDGVAGPIFANPAMIPHESMYPVLQLAIQAGHRPAAGSTMQVDYVRAWLPVG